VLETTVTWLAAAVVVPALGEPDGSTAAMTASTATQARPPSVSGNLLSQSGPPQASLSVGGAKMFPHGCS
jgi:hypothetical protein